MDNANYITFNKKATRKMRKAVAERDGNQCRYCGIVTDEPTIDYVVPLEWEGKGSYSNTVIACPRCIKQKGSNIGWQAMTTAQARSWDRPGEINPICLPKTTARVVVTERSYGLRLD